MLNITGEGRFLIRDLSQVLCFSWYEVLVSLDRLSVCAAWPRLSLARVVFPLVRSLVDAPPCPRHGLVLRRGAPWTFPGWRGGLGWFCSSLLFNSNSHLKLCTNSTLVAPTIWYVKANKQFNTCEISHHYYCGTNVTKQRYQIHDQVF